MGQTYLVYACTGTNYARHFIASRYIFLQLEAMDFKVTLETNSIESLESMGQFDMCFVEKLRNLKRH